MNSAGQKTHETHNDVAGGPGGQTPAETQDDAAARKKSAGQSHSETQNSLAGGPGGQAKTETQTPAAARKKSKIAGHRRRETQIAFAGNGADRGQGKRETQERFAAIRATIDTLIEVGRRNDFAIRQRMRTRQATLSHIARSAFGYHTKLPEGERKKAMDAAAKLVKEIRSGEEHHLSMFVHATDAAAAPWEEIQSQAEKEMIKRARKLPAYEWVQSVHGFGELSFARIIAETGDLSGYDNPSRVWKRLGLAVFDERAQRRTRDADKAVEQGYSPRRRSVSWVAFHGVYLAQSARKDPGGQNSCETHEERAAGEAGAGQETHETQAGPAGPYRCLYDQKKAEYLERVAAGEAGWTVLRADRAAKRYAEKRLLRDLWVAWTRDIVGRRSGETQGIVAGDGDRGGQVSIETQHASAAPVAPE